MKKKTVLFSLFIILVAGAGAAVLLDSRYHFISLLDSRYHFMALLGGKTGPQTGSDVYYCPMHPDYTSDKPGECPICHMSLVKRQAAPKPDATAAGPKAERKILYYRSPMNPDITSPVPMKDAMGMDYVPVYEEGQAGQAEAVGVYVSPQRQQLIGVKKEKIEPRRLTHQIVTVGRVAYDPELFIAQEEYLQSLEGQRPGGDGGGAGVGPGLAQTLAKAARQKLLLLGMSSEQIEQLAKTGKSQQNLYLLTGSEKTVWVYITIYEYEIGFIKEGQPVEVEAVAYPGQVFHGTIAALSPTFDAATRSVHARAEVENPDGQLRLGMYVNVKVNADLGEKLAVPADAVLDSGLRKIVVVALPNGYFQSKQVKLGEKAQGYFEVLEGMVKDQEVVTQANFLIDSESRLNTALSRMSSEPNQ